MNGSQPQAPGYVRWVVRTLEEEGYATYAVGGAIRNTLLGLPAGDWDLTTRAPPGVVQRIFPRTIPVGVEHGTVGVLTRDGVLLEVTTFRRDVETTGRHAVVEFAETLEEDLARRDFTVNAVAWHPLRGEFRDPFGGMADLEGRLLRTVGEPEDRFAEDYLRVLRALRFSGRFRLRIHAPTWASLCRATPHLGVLSPERVREELLKVLGQDASPSGALSLYAASGALKALFPEIPTAEGRFREGSGEDLWTHSILLADLLPEHRPLLRLTSLLQGVERKDPEGAGPGPRPSPPQGAAALLVRCRFSNAEAGFVMGLLAMGLEAPVHLSDPGDLRRWLSRAGAGRLPDFARIWLAKARMDQLLRGHDPGPTLTLLGRLRAERRTRPPLAVEDLAINGRNLIGAGLKPGPRFGSILERLLDRVLDDPSLNERRALMELVERMEAQRDEGEAEGPEEELK